MNAKALAAALRSKADLRDVYGYIDNSGNTAYAFGPNEANGDNPGWGTTGGGLAWADQSGQGADGNVPASAVTFNPRDPFRGAVSLISNSANNEGSGGFRFDVDGSKLPQTRFGDVTRTAAVDDSTRVFDPSMVYDDQNYGRITHGANVDARSWSDMVGPALVAAAMAGIGALGAPTWATSLVGGARGLAEGGARGGAGAILGALGSLAGVPGWMTGIGRFALSQALRNR